MAMSRGTSTTFTTAALTPSVNPTEQTFNIWRPGITPVGASPAPVAATPSVPSVAIVTAAPASIKIATPELILIKEESLPKELMTNLIFEDIGGQEIINIARNDIVNGQDVIYQPIKNLTNIALQYNPKNILSIQDSSESYFDNFSIKLYTHIPVVGTGPDGETTYIDLINGDLILNVINMINDEQVEVQILDSGSLLDDTIY